MQAIRSNWFFAATLYGIACLPLLAHGSSVDKRVPGEAAAVISRVAAAAQKRDLAKLRPLMTDEFGYVFRSEGDPNRGRDTADDAMAFWNKHPQLLRKLARATKSSCGRQGQAVICPANAGAGFRAIFEPRNGRWLMTAFLEGD